MLIINQKDFLHILEHVISELPNEGCGILAGKRGRVILVYPATNTEKSPERYLMDPREQADAIQDMRRRDLEIVGIYHSHVNGPAYPSQRDLQMAYYPDAVYVIISLEDPERPEIRGFWIREGTIREEEISFQNNK